MTVSLFDVQTGFGGGKPGVREEVNAEDWLAEMARLSIDRALVRTLPAELDSDIPVSNEMLFRTCSTHKELVPCPVLVPGVGRDFPPAPEQVAAVIEKGGVAGCLRPKEDYWLAAEWASGDLFRALSDRSLPAYCVESEFGLESIAELAGNHSELPFILAETGYRSQRTLLSLLQTFGNIYLSIGNRYTVSGGIAQIVEIVGAQQLLFGTGFPDSDPMPAITMLMYAEISNEEKVLIGSQNMERLIEGVK